MRHYPICHLRVFSKSFRMLLPSCVWAWTPYFQGRICPAVTNQTEPSCVCFLTRLLYLWFTFEDCKGVPFIFNSDCCLFNSCLWCLHLVMQRRNHFIQSLTEFSGGRENDQNTTRASQEYKLHLRTKELGINDRIFRYFPHLYIQITWEFALRCLCQVKTATEQRSMKCRMRKRGHSMWRCSRAINNKCAGLQVYPKAWFISGQIQTSALI